MIKSITRDVLLFILLIAFSSCAGGGYMGRENGQHLNQGKPMSYYGKQAKHKKKKTLSVNGTKYLKDGKWVKRTHIPARG